MSLTNGPNLGILVNGAAGEAHYNELMAQWRGLDALVMPVIKDRDLTAPPGSPADGDTYIPAATATGAWAGHEKKIARYSSVAAGWEFFAPKEGWEVYAQDENAKLRYDGSAWAAASAGVQNFSLTVAASDETTTITTGTSKLTFYWPFDATLSEVFIGVSAQSTSGVVRADVNKAGSTIFSTRPSIDANEDTNLTGTVAVLSTTSFIKGDKMTIDIDDAGTGAKGLKVTFNGTR